MSRTKWAVYLTNEEREELEEIVGSGTYPSKMIRRANILLLCNEERPGGSKTIRYICEALGTSVFTVSTVKKEFNEQGLASAISRKQRVAPPVESKVTGDVEARIIALACSEPPEGWARWNLRLLADKVVELEILDTISYGTVRTVLKKTNINLTDRSGSVSHQSRTQPS